MITIKQIETTMADTIKKETGLTVNITCRNAEKWTVSGYDAVKAAEWMQNNGIFTIEECVEFDEDPGFMFCYMLRK